MQNEFRRSAAEQAISSVAPGNHTVPKPLEKWIMTWFADKLMIVPMLPVSGAEQFTASEAIGPPRPRISAITAYYTLRTQQSDLESTLNTSSPLG